MSSEESTAGSPHASAAPPPGQPRWLFRGDVVSLDALATSVARDPDAPVAWPIAPSGPSMAIGDGVLLWRSGRGGGIVAACTVLDDPVAALGPDGAPRVTVDVRVDRAFARPLTPAELLADATLRPLAFFDLHAAGELRLGADQRAAFAAAVTRRDAGPAPTEDDDTVMLEVPRRLAPVVEELLLRLGAHEPAPPVGAPLRAGGAPTTPTTPTDLQVDQAQLIAGRHGTQPFTVDEVAATWRTGIGTARSRIERLIESGLVVRAGTLRPEERHDGRATRGRPPVLYRLAPAGTAPREAPLEAP